MPYSRYRSPGSRMRLAGAMGASRPDQLHGGEYKSQGSGVKRHEYTASLSGSMATMLPNEYMYAKLLRFVRNDGVTDDTPPAPTASNNYQTDAVMNGSAIRNYNATITIKNLSSTIEALLDVYEVQLSFFDALVWNTVFPSLCPVTFDNTTTGPPDIRGEVDYKAVVATIFVDNSIKNYKFVAHYAKKRGTIQIGNLDNNNVAHITLNRVPPKCRRSQSGMLWGLFFVNNSELNNAATLTFKATLANAFDEIPADNRLPYP